MSSIFTRPRARPPLSSVSSQQNFIAVKTEDELLAALTSLPRSDGNCYGRGISIVGDITLKGTIALSVQHSGITITSPSRAKISTVGTLDKIFSLHGTDGITISGLFFSKDTSATSIIESLTSTSVNNDTNLSFVDNTISYLAPVTRVLTPNSGCDYGLTIKSNKITQSVSSIALIYGPMSSSNVSDCVIAENVGFSGGINLYKMFRGMISSNINIGSVNIGPLASLTVLSGNSLAGNVRLDGRRNVVSGNQMQGYNIDLTGTIYPTDQQNVIVGNVNVGTVTINSTTDAVTSNT